MSKSRKGPGARRRKGAKAASPGALPDLATLVALLMASEHGRDCDDPLGEAQDKAFDAMESADPAERIRLAREALDLSPLCADAYLVLARETKDAQAALPLYRQACEAGAEALGAEAFEEDAGHFWGLIETRPYMRARQELAMALWEVGEREAAAQHYREMLRLNPNDNQGIRYLLIDALLALGAEAEAERLLEQYEKDGSAAMAWSAALLAFRRDGRSKAADAALKRAIDANPHVPDYLLGRRKLPESLPALIGLGDRNEAIAYVHGAAPIWAETEGARAWVEAAANSGTQY